MRPLPDQHAHDLVGPVRDDDLVAARLEPARPDPPAGCSDRAANGRPTRSRAVPRAAVRLVEPRRRARLPSSARLTVSSTRFGSSTANHERGSAAPGAQRSGVVEPGRLADHARLAPAAGVRHDGVGELVRGRCRPRGSGSVGERSRLIRISFAVGRVAVLAVGEERDAEAVLGEVGEAVPRHLVAGQVVARRVVRRPLGARRTASRRSRSGCARPPGRAPSASCATRASRPRSGTRAAARPRRAAPSARMVLRPPDRPLERDLGAQRPGRRAPRTTSPADSRRPSRGGTDRRPRRRTRSGGRRRAGGRCPARRAPRARCRLDQRARPGRRGPARRAERRSRARPRRRPRRPRPRAGRRRRPRRSRTAAPRPRRARRPAPSATSARAKPIVLNGVGAAAVRRAPPAPPRRQRRPRPRTSAWSRAASS